MNQNRRMLLATGIGMIVGGVAIAIITNAIPKMMQAMMAKMMAQMKSQMRAQMLATGCSPAEM